jgi:hypothetical protein
LTNKNDELSPQLKEAQTELKVRNEEISGLRWKSELKNEDIRSLGGVLKGIPLE